MYSVLCMLKENTVLKLNIDLLSYDKEKHHE